jgi:hypothetical protein
MASRVAEVACASAWTTYLLLHDDVDEDDDRHAALDRYVTNLCDSGEQDPDALQTAGLVYLRKLDQLGEEREARLASYRALDRAI